MKKLLFLIDTLEGGGAERVLVNLVNNLDFSKYDITVETMFHDGVNKELLDKRVKVISKNAFCPRGINYIYRLIPSKFLYNKFVGKRDYDVLIAYMHNLPTKVLSGAPKDKTKYTWLHYGNPSESTMFNCWINKKSAFKSYEKFTGIVGVSESVVDAFSEYTGISKNLFVVYNTNDCKKIISEGEKPCDTIDKSRISFCSIGRLDPQKGYVRLLKIAKNLFDEGYDFNLYIAGKGQQEKELNNYIEKNNMKERVFLLGFQKNPYSIVNHSDVFVCSSYEEGLSTAVTEAIILGKTVITTMVSGAEEIVGKNNEYGILVDNSDEGIMTGMKMILDNNSLIDTFAEKAKNRSEFFGTDNTVKQFISLIESENTL